MGVMEKDISRALWLLRGVLLVTALMATVEVRGMLSKGGEEEVFAQLIGGLLDASTEDLSAARLVA